MTTEYTLDDKAYVADDSYGPVQKKEIIAAGADLLKGTILGRITKALGAVTPDGGNTGNGTVTGAALKAKTKIGDYVLECITAAANGGVFKVLTPSGERLDDAAVGTAYANDHLAFTVNDGAADFVVGDKFTLTVGAGSRKFKAYAAGAGDGSQDPVRVLLEEAKAAAADAEAVVGSAGVYVKANMTGLDQAAEDALEARGIYFV